MPGAGDDEEGEVAEADAAPEVPGDEFLEDLDDVKKGIRDGVISCW